MEKLNCLINVHDARLTALTVSVSGLAECVQQGRWIEESGFEVGTGPQRARANRVSLVSEADPSVTS